MRYVKDRTGRFGERPHYQPEELDHECEKIISEYLQEKHGTISFPIDTEDLKSMIECDAHELDCYADLSEYGQDVEGVTEFRPGSKPIVRISKELTENTRYENRLRTTLTHEFGHVRFHAYLFSLSQDQGELFQKTAPTKLISKRENILNAPQTDWMEWQAGYACGAFLMPVTSIRTITGEFTTARNHYGPISSDSQNGRDLLGVVSKHFQVSSEAARIRLTKLGVLGSERGPSLFS